MDTNSIIVENEIIRCSSIREYINSVPKCSGVYKIYVDEIGLEQFEDMQPLEYIDYNAKKLYLLYIGKSKDIQNRLEWHLGFFNISHQNILNATLSTLRFSLIAFHKNLELNEQNELNNFMDSYMYMQYNCSLDANKEELILIGKHITPLNIKDNAHPKKFQLINQRKSKKQKYIERMNKR